jgi:hypothetical protein
MSSKINLLSPHLGGLTSSHRDEGVTLVADYSYIIKQSYDNIRGGRPGEHYEFFYSKGLETASYSYWRVILYDPEHITIQITY